MHPFNRDEIFALAKKIKEELPSKTVWLYTGFLWEEVKQLEGIKYLDVLIDGEFKKELNDNNLCWIGSSNQRIIDVQKSLEKDEIVLFLEQ